MDSLRDTKKRRVISIDINLSVLHNQHCPPPLTNSYGGVLYWDDGWIPVRIQVAPNKWQLTSHLSMEHLRRKLENPEEIYKNRHEIIVDTLRVSSLWGECVHHYTTNQLVSPSIRLLFCFNQFKVAACENTKCGTLRRALHTQEDEKDSQDWSWIRNVR